MTGEERTARFVTFTWAVSAPERISRPAMSALVSQRAVREPSVISLCQVAVKQPRSKLTLHKKDLVKGVADLRLRILRYAANHAYRMFNLPLHHADPFARQIMVQALAQNSPACPSDLVTLVPSAIKRR